MEKMAIKPTPLGFFLKHYYLLLLAFPVALAVLAASFAGMFALDFLVIAAMLVTLLALTALGAAHSKLHYNATSVYANEDKLVHETGILHRHIKKLPLHMITDTSVKRSLFDMAIGTATLNISTSGRSGYEVSVSCLPHSEAESFHDRLYATITENQAKLRAEPSQNSPVERP